MATDYTSPAVMEKRTRFFDGQFLVDQDFVDEQKYHLDRQRRHQRVLHVSGVCEGLEVRATALNTVSVGPGTAIDVDGRTLALATAVTVDLPGATFNSKSGVTVYLTYQEVDTDEQKGQGSADNTRWLERPAVVRLLPGEPWTGSTPLVTLAQLALDGRGAVTVDLANRQYAGVRLPGPAADPAALRSVASGAAALQGTLSVTGHVGIGTSTPENAEGWGRALDVLGEVSAKLSVRTSSGGKVDARVMAHDTGIYGSAAGMLAGTRSAHPLSLVTNGATRVTVSSAGRVGIGTDPKQEPKQDLTVAGRMAVESGVIQRGGTTAITTTSDLGLYSQIEGQYIRIVTNKAPVRFYTDSGTGTAARLTVEADGDVGVGVDAPGARLDVSAVAGKTESSLLLRSGNAANAFDATQVAFGWNGGSQYRHAIRTRHNGSAVTGNALDFYVWAHSTAAGAPDALGGTHVMSLDGGHVGVGTATAENAENWTRVVDVLGTTDAKFSVRTGTGKVDGRVMAHDSGIYASAPGMVVGTKSNHAVSVATNGASRLTVTADGHLGIGTLPQNTDNLDRVVDLLGDRSAMLAIRTRDMEGRVMLHDRQLFDADRGMIVGTKTAHPVSLAANGAARLTIASDGSVGIGTMRPRPLDAVSQLVDVYGKASAQLVMRTERIEGFLTVSETAFGPASGGSASAGLILGTRGGSSVALVAGGGRPALTVNQNGQVVIPEDLFVRRLTIQTGSAEWKVLLNKAGGDPVTAQPAPTPVIPSDARLKTAVRPLTGALAAVLRLTGLRYRWAETGLDYLTRDVAEGLSAGPGATDDEHRQLRVAAVARARAALDGDDIGLLAQDVERVVPEVVQDGPDGYKHIRYAQLTALLVEAVKEQQTLIGDLRTRIAACEAR
jgi:hypothetical protein